MQGASNDRSDADLIRAAASDAAAFGALYDRYALRVYYAAAVALVAVVGVAVVVVLERTAWSQSGSPVLAARPAATAGTTKPRIAFVSTSSGRGRAAIYVMNADGSARRKVTSYNGWAPGDLAWSPDAEKIAIPRGYPGRSDIYVVRVDGSGERRLTSDPALDVSPAWSPDGRRIAFVRTRIGSPRASLYAMNADGSSQRRLRRNVGGGPPVWSPNGRKLAFVGGTKLAFVDLASLRHLRHERRRERAGGT